MKQTLFFTAFLLTLLSQDLVGQAWKYESGEDPFTGKFRNASVVGTSTNRTYDSPVFVVNNFDNSTTFNIYISNIGYFCDNLKISFKFDNNDDLFWSPASEDNKQNVAFISTIYKGDSNSGDKQFGKFEFLELLQTHSKMYVRIEDDCDFARADFSLSGSTKAIQFVYGDKAKIINDRLEKWKKEGRD